MYFQHMDYPRMSGVGDSDTEYFCRYVSCQYGWFLKQREPGTVCGFFKSKMYKIKIRKITFHIFHRNKLPEKFYQITDTYSGILHKLILSFKTAVIFIAAYGIAVGKNSRVYIPCCRSQALARVSEIFGGQIFIFFVISASHTYIKIVA